MAENSNFHKIFHVEILRQTNSLLENNEAVMRVSNWLKLQDVIGKEFSITKFDDEFLKEHIQSITIYENAIKTVNGDFPETRYYVYNFNSFAPEIDEAEDEQQISTQWTLPTQEFNDVWDSLIYDSNVKDELLNYVETALDFSDKSVNSSIISWNRIVLLHGPPGTGKTSLCKALAQKISIRFSSKFSYGQLIEVNTHSLFSKWFSESGKLVTKMFHSILNLLEDPNVLVIVLLDEVETLARSRSSALSGNEPSDALRVVNAVLTHLDMIKRYPNVLILTTSNITDAIDVALIDRADIKQYIGLPSVEAIYQIYSSCIKELQQCGVICTRELLLPMRRLKTATEGHSNEPYHHEERSLKLKFLAEQSVGFSGRTLRKMPFIACALFIKTKLVSLDAFLDALSKAVERQWRDVNQLKVQA
ncbi:pachytene checkpoint protein 2 homolog [Caerostris darwini]|uniref:Pachytene checkpoint protein 2 homolog n=1 Tax=Caerostris darwini TaxID=1538125 RepID=A0AAV4PFP0_9ARAC|nr:pachytene checkpoint protein 2 homolog [Caerostris darwini]